MCASCGSIAACTTNTPLRLSQTASSSGTYTTLSIVSGRVKTSHTVFVLLTLAPCTHFVTGAAVQALQPAPVALPGPAPPLKPPPRRASTPAASMPAPPAPPSSKKRRKESIDGTPDQESKLKKPKLRCVQSAFWDRSTIHFFHRECVSYRPPLSAIRPVLALI